MVVALINFISQFLSLSWLTGPIFDKELRVSSRRKRNYVLRFIYLALLTLFLVLIWLNEVKYRGNAAYHISRMARAGQTITSFIIWFQFCATQLIAVIMLSTSISNEIYNRTLGVLMTTPINSFQIVMGKLFSKLLQLILFLAISLPLLAIVRIFGGVPWDYVITSLCITLTTIIFVGSLSLFFSIFSRRAYVVIILTILTLGVLFALIPLVTAMLWHMLHWCQIIPEKYLAGAFFYLNPYAIMVFITEQMFNPSAGRGIPTIIWPIHCAITLTGSAIMLALSVFKVRKVALRQATGQIGTKKSKTIEYRKLTSVIKHVKGPPVLWKERRLPIFGRHKLITFITLGIGMLLLIATYFFCAGENILDEEAIHMIYVCVFMGLGMLFTIILPATSITAEKESRSWPLLLATTLSDWQILCGKFIGAIRRCLPVWILLLGHIIVFTFAGFIHPIAILQMAILVTWVIIFFSCTGLYFSSRFKHTTTAVVMNFALAIVFWLLIPFLMVLILEITRMGDDLIEAYCNAIPFVQAVVVMEATVASWGPVDVYRWPQMRLDALEATLFMLAFMIGYIFLGFLFAWRAKCRFRRNIF